MPMASPFELIYIRAPLLTGSGIPSRIKIPSIEEVAAHASRAKVNLMARKNVRNHEDVLIGDMVHIWRDGDGWIGPAPVTKVTSYEVAVSHNNHTKSASRNRVRKILPESILELEDENDNRTTTHAPHQGSPVAAQLDNVSNAELHKSSSKPDIEELQIQNQMPPAATRNNAAMDGDQEAISTVSQRHPHHESHNPSPHTEHNSTPPSSPTPPQRSQIDCENNHSRAKRALHDLTEEGMRFMGTEEPIGKTRLSTKTLREAARSGKNDEEPAPALVTWGDATFVSPETNTRQANAIGTTSCLQQGIGSMEHASSIQTCRTDSSTL